MNYKKYLILFLSFFILVACKKLPEAQGKTVKNEEEIAKNIFEKAKSLKENTYKEKVEKYIQYQKALAYDKNLKEPISLELKRLDKKIEKTLDYRIIGGNDELLNSKIEENFKIYIEHNPFTKSENNPDLILEINPVLVEYSPESVKATNYQREYIETYTDENGKEAENKVIYSGNEFKKLSSIKVELRYKLISTLTGEVILSDSKPLDKVYYVNWSKYFILSDKVMDESRIPRDSMEESLPKKEKIFEEMAIQILREINRELRALPKNELLEMIRIS